MQPNTNAPSGTAHVSASRSRVSPHERLTGIGLAPLGRASEFADDIYGLMAKTPLFSGLDMAETHTLGAFMYVYDAPAGLTLINEGDATAYDIELLGETVRNRVFATSGIRLDWEIKRFGNFAEGRAVEPFLGA